MKKKSKIRKWKVTLYGPNSQKTFRCRTREICRQLKDAAYDEGGWSGPITKIK
jgi:hypothetical protein